MSSVKEKRIFFGKRETLSLEKDKMERRNFYGQKKIPHLHRFPARVHCGRDSCPVFLEGEKRECSKGWCAGAGDGRLCGRRGNGMSRTVALHLKIGRNTVVWDRQVRLSDIADMECTDEAVLRQLKQKKVYTFREDAGSRKNQLVVVSVLKIMEQIHKDYPELEISNEGETDFIIEYVSFPEKPEWVNIIKTVVLCILIFFGAAFTIMAFNNDVGVGDVFAKFYRQVTGVESDSVTELEICYSIGLSLGILIFFNHVGRKKITHDPTPIQIEMRKYESDLDTAFIENAERKGHNINVD